MGNNISTPPSPLKVIERLHQPVHIAHLVTHTTDAHAPTTHTHDEAVAEIIKNCNNANNEADICKYVNIKDTNN